MRTQEDWTSALDSPWVAIDDRDLPREAGGIELEGRCVLTHSLWGLTREGAIQAAEILSRGPGASNPSAMLPIHATDVPAEAEPGASLLETLSIGAASLCVQWLAQASSGWQQQCCR